MLARCCGLCEHDKTMNTETMILTFVHVVWVAYFLDFWGWERYDFRKNLQNPTHKEIVFCYVSRIFAYFILPHVVLYFIFSCHFLVIIVLHRAHKDAHLICLNFVSCHVNYYLFYFNAPAGYYILIFGTKKLCTFISPHIS